MIKRSVAIQLKHKVKLHHLELKEPWESFRISWNYLHAVIYNAEFKTLFHFPNIGSVSLYPKMSMISLMISSIHVFCTTVEHLQSWLSCVSRNVCVTTYVHVGEMSWEYPDWNVVVGGPQPSCPVMSDRHKVMAIRTVDKQKCQY